MRYTLLIINIFFVAIVSGCNTDDNGIKKFGYPVFDTRGDIDLSLYFIPDDNVTVTYKKQIWIDSDDSKSFDGDANESYPVYTYKKNLNIVTKQQNRDNEFVFKTNEKNITVVKQTEDGNITQYYARFADKDDPILYQIYSITKNGNEIVQESGCKLVDDRLSQVVLGRHYEKVISIECDINKTTISKFDGDKIVKNTTTAYSGFFSKYQGPIKETTQSCTRKTINGNIYNNSCKKIVVQLINLIK